ncbi:MAG: Fur family transcriptional regulator [Candidatus Limnocylindrales bacterium]
MSVIAARWSQSKPCLNPSTRAVIRRAATPPSSSGTSALLHVVAITQLCITGGIVVGVSTARASRRSGARSDAWSSARDQLHARGLRWTPQRRLLLSVLEESSGHVTATELIERCRAEDPGTIPSTVYRTLDVLEDLGLVRHGHGADGREEFHVLPQTEHGHLFCRSCGDSWEVDPPEAASLVNALAKGRGFAVDLSHLNIVGLCSECLARGS